MKLTDRVIDEIAEAMDWMIRSKDVSGDVAACLRELRDTAAETVLFHEQDYGFCLDPKCRCCAALKKLKALLPEKADERTAPDS